MDLRDINSLKSHLPQFAISDLTFSENLLRYIDKISTSKSHKNVIIYIRYSSNTDWFYKFNKKVISSFDNPIIFNLDNWLELTSNTHIQAVLKIINNEDNCVICLETNHSGHNCTVCGSSICLKCSEKMCTVEAKKMNTSVRCPICREEVCEIKFID